MHFKDIVSIAALYPNSQYLNAEDVLEDPRLVIRNFLKANHYDDIDAMRDKVIQRESTEKEYKNLLKCVIIFTTFGSVALNLSIF